jgi:hypothetical protein
MLTVSLNGLYQVGYKIEASFQHDINTAPGLFDSVFVFDESVIGLNKPAYENNEEKNAKNNDRFHIVTFSKG